MESDYFAVSFNLITVIRNFFAVIVVYLFGKRFHSTGGPITVGKMIYCALQGGIRRVFFDIIPAVSVSGKNIVKTLCKQYFELLRNVFVVLVVCCNRSVVRRSENVSVACGMLIAVDTKADISV